MTNAFTFELSPLLTTKSGLPLGIGTGTGTKWKDLKRSDSANGDFIVESIKLALAKGFRHIDTAEAYTTHPEVARAIKESEVPREDIFVTTKFSPGGNNFFVKQDPEPKDFVDTALKELGTDYIDLLLLHHPFFENDSVNTLESAWKQLIDAKAAGKVRYIGGSNFAIEHLKKVIKISGDAEFYPVVNQIEFHPYLQNQSEGIIEFCQNNNILVEAYGPLTPIFRIKKDDKEVSDHPLTKVLPELSEKYGKTQAQILLRYTLQRKILPITTSSVEDRIEQSLDIYNFELEKTDIEKISTVGDTFSYRAFFKGKFD